MKKIKCKNCGNVAELVDGKCDKCEVKAEYIVLEEKKVKKSKKEKE